MFAHCWSFFFALGGLLSSCNGQIPMYFTESTQKDRKGDYCLYQQAVGDLCFAADVYNQANRMDFVLVCTFMMKLIMQ